MVNTTSKAPALTTNKPFSGYPELLEDFGSRVLSRLLKEGIAAEVATRVALAVIDQMRFDWGGLKVYFPSGRGIDQRERDRDIQRCWDGRNTVELCRKYRISEAYLRIIAARARIPDKA